MLLTLWSLALLLISLRHVNGQSLPTAWIQGIATNYGGAQDGMDPSSPSYGTLDGACGYGQLNPNTYPFWSVAALSLSNQFSIAGPSDACGQCFEIQCLNNAGQFAGRCSSSQSVTVTITDTCPECEANHIDIQALTFNKIAPMAIGRIDMQYRRVDCTPPTPVSLAIDANVGVGGWLRLVVEKTAGFGGITLVQMRTSGTGSWLSMENQYGSAWEISNTPSLPWDFQFTSDASQTVQAMSLVSQNGVVGNIPTSVQFSLSGLAGGQSISYGDQQPAASPPVGINAVSSPTTSTPPVGSTTTTTTPSASPTANVGTPPTPSTSSCCVDSIPPGGLTCAQQQAYGKCNADWMSSGNFCQATCGTCPSSCSGSTTATQGSVQTSSISSTSPSSTTPASTQASSCTDNPPPGSSQTCPALAASGACYGAVQSPYCNHSCYRC